MRSKWKLCTMLKSNYHLKYVYFFSTFILSKKKSFIYPLPYHFLERLKCWHYVWFAPSYLCIAGGDYDDTIGSRWWHLGCDLCFDSFLPMHWRLTWSMIGLSMTYVKFVVDIINFKRYFYLVLEKGFEDGLIRFDNNRVC